MSRPSITDMALPYIVTEMQIMKEQMDFMMNALRGRVSSDLDDLVHLTIHHIRQLLPATIEVPHAADRKL